MKDHEYTLIRNKKLADNIRNCAEKLIEAMNEAGQVGLIVQVTLSQVSSEPIYEESNHTKIKYIGDKTRFHATVSVTSTERF